MSPTGHHGLLQPHLAVAQDEMWQNSAHGFAGRALHPPHGETAQADMGVMGVARQAPTATTGCLVCKLQAKGQEKGKDAFEKRLAVAKKLNVGPFIVEIDGDGAVFTGWAGCVSHGPPQSDSRCHWCPKMRTMLHNFKRIAVVSELYH